MALSCLWSPTSVTRTCSPMGPFQDLGRLGGGEHGCLVDDEVVHRWQVVGVADRGCAAAVVLAAGGLELVDAQAGGVLVVGGEVDAGQEPGDGAAVDAGGVLQSLGGDRGGRYPVHGDAAPAEGVSDGVQGGGLAAAGGADDDSGEVAAGGHLPVQGQLPVGEGLAVAESSGVLQPLCEEPFGVGGVEAVGVLVEPGGERVHDGLLGLQDSDGRELPCADAARAGTGRRCPRRAGTRGS